MDKDKEASYLEERVLKYLEGHNTISLATVSEDRPHAASVFYVNIGFELFYVSDPKSRHSRSLAANPLMSGTINEDYFNWLEIKGIQIEGSVSCVGSIVGNPRIVKTYVAKFPNVKDFFIAPLKLGPEIVKKVSAVRFFKITPSRIFFLDNSMGFGHREELVLTDL